MATGAGPWGTVNAAYQAYAKAVGFHVDACLPRCPEHKGKVENKVRFVRRRLHLVGPFADLAKLQGQTDAQLAASDERRICPVTGSSVAASWCAEQARLRPLPLLPEPFDLMGTRPVYKDCTVSFEGCTYSPQRALPAVWAAGRVAWLHPRSCRSGTTARSSPNTHGTPRSACCWTRRTTKA